MLRAIALQSFARAVKEGEVISKVQFWVWFAFAFPVVLQGAFAYADNFLTPRQVEEHWGRGLPFLVHGGMWSGIVLFAPLMAYLISTHGGEQWKGLVGYAIAFGVAASYMMHFGAYIPAGRIIPEAHTHHGVLTVAGWILLGYMAVSIAVLVLYYLSTRDVAPAEVWTISGVLLVHVVISTHVPFRAWARWAEPVWYPLAPVLDPATVFTIVGAGLVLAALSFWR